MTCPLDSAVSIGPSIRCDTGRMVPVPTWVARCPFPLGRASGPWSPRTSLGAGLRKVPHETCAHRASTKPKRDKPDSRPAAPRAASFKTSVNHHMNGESPSPYKHLAWTIGPALIAELSSVPSPSLARGSAPCAFFVSVLVGFFFFQTRF